MPSLLLVVFVLQLFIHLVNTVGAPVINEFVWTLFSYHQGSFVPPPLTSLSQLWNLYNRLPTSTSADAKAQIELQKEVIRLKREMNATSSQDEFAKWAKLRRSHDKNLAQYDEKSE